MSMYFGAIVPSLCQFHWFGLNIFYCINTHFKCFTMIFSLLIKKMLIVNEAWTHRQLKFVNW